MRNVKHAVSASSGHWSPVPCHVCGFADMGGVMTEVLETGVTSDCRPWPHKVPIVCCSRCRAVQAPVDPEWRRCVEDIYRAYDTYAAAGGREQKVMAESGDAVHARSKVLLGWLSSLDLLATTGDAIDIGCGRGSFLEAFAGLYAQWGLHGTEFDDKNLSALRQLPGFKGLQTGRFEDIAGQFDFFSMLHVLEHIENPVSCLAALRNRARDGALLLVQVPDWTTNPFALAIADHATHFTPSVLAAVARAAGWEPVTPVTPVVPKELTLLARAGRPDAGALETQGNDESRRLSACVLWLKDICRSAQSVAAASSNFGLFGTAVAGTWLAGSCSGHQRFFVDEDPHRIGSAHLGIPIISPGQVKPGADVFVGMAPLVSARLVEKFKNGGARYHGVPPLEEV